MLTINQPIKSIKPAPRYPKCDSRSVARIIYGLVAMDDELERDLQLGRVYLGGCDDPPWAPKWHCNDFEHEFGVPPEWRDIRDKLV